VLGSRLVDLQDRLEAESLKPSTRRPAAPKLGVVPSVVPNPKAIRAFKNEAAFDAWLAKNHDKAPEVWIKIFKKASGKPSIDASQGIDVALCWGWIDGIRKPLDDEAFLQRYTPRTAKSRWSQINTERVERLIKAGRMTAHGRLQIDAAKADGRWAAAYPSPRNLELPAEFLKALTQKGGVATKTFSTLKKSQIFSIAYRLHHLKSAESRAKLTAAVLTKLAAGEEPFVLRKVVKKP
jgi:uncharacterized protein YdeI (YjbR/CyaY-like superfamily)